MKQETESSLLDLQLDQNIQFYLGKIARLVKIITIVGFIGCGLVVIAGILENMHIANFSGLHSSGTFIGFTDGLILLFYIGAALIGFLTCLSLFKFASRMQTALRTNDQQELTKSFRSLQSCCGLLAIVAIACLGLLILGMLFL